MKIDRLETHDRYLQFNKQADYISQGCRYAIGFKHIKQYIEIGGNR